MKVGLVGYGRWGRNLARSAREAGGDIVWVSEPYRAESVDLGVQVFKSIRAAQDRAPADVAIIAAPTAVHTALTLEAIDLGLHIHVEKPFAPDARTAANTLERARSAKVLVSVGHEFAYHRAFQEILLPLRFGPGLVDLTWLNDRPTDVIKHASTWQDLAPHPLSLLATLGSGWEMRASFRGDDFIEADYFRAGVEARVRVGAGDRWRKTRLAVVTTNFGTRNFDDASATVLLPDEALIRELSALFLAVGGDTTKLVTGEEHILETSRMMEVAE